MRIFKVLLFFLLIISNLNAQKAKEDTIRTYRLGEIVKTADRYKRNITPSAIHEVNFNEIQRSDAVSVAGLKNYIPSALVQTNSRGETLLYLRGAAERQLALFFDGALINVPWDNRMDLSFVPADIIGRIKITQGAASVLYGTNVLGGAVDIATYERTNDGFSINAEAEFADGLSQHYAFTHDGKKGIFNYIMNFSYLTSPGIIQPDIEQEGRYNEFDKLVEEDLFDGGIINNSDQERLTAYGRGEFQFKNTTIGMSVNHVGGEKGVLPESYLKLKDARYWRYPDWDRWLFTLNGEQILSDDLNMKLNGTIWYDIFKQEIASYRSINYDSIEETQQDQDNTLGGRISYGVTPVKDHNITVALNFSSSEHNEIILDSINILKSDLDFEQILYSAGAEYQAVFKDLVLTAGASFDGINTPLAGNFIEAEGNNITDYGVIAGGRYFASDRISLFANVSRKTRFPTLREQFSAALGKFLVNPNLGAESGILSEAGLNYKFGDLNLNFALFANFYDGLIGRTNIIDPVDSLRKQMRINIDEARIAGAEINFNYIAAPGLDFQGNLSYMYSEGKEENKWGRKLEYKPMLLAFLLSRYNVDKFGFQIEADILGSQYAEDPYLDEFIELDPTLKLNIRTSYRTIIQSLAVVELYLRLDNIFDIYRQPKYGLPEAGRTLSGGIKLII